MTEEEINHSKLFIFECTLLLDYKNMYSSVIDALLNDYLYFTTETKLNILSNETLNLYRLFFNNLKDYLHSKPYSRIQEFVFIDQKWYNIRVNYLIPFILAAEKDFETKGLDFVSTFEQANIENRPENKEILNV